LNRSCTKPLWSLAGIGALLGLWGWGAAAYGPFILPRPGEAFGQLFNLFVSGEAQKALVSTSQQALGGWLIGGLCGFALALGGAFAAGLRLVLQPIAKVLLGVPPVAWVVLAVLWFGPSGFSTGFTVAVAILPVIFIAALQGLESRDASLDEMAQSFGATPAQKFTDILAPQLLAHLLPAIVTALGFAFKVCVMAEVMVSGEGIGGRLSMARAHLDLPEAFAWIILIVLLVLVFDLALIAPLRQILAGWRPAQRAG